MDYLDGMWDVIDQQLSPHTNARTPPARDGI